MTYWLAMAKKEKRSTSAVAWQAVLLAGYTNKDARELTKAAMMRNLSIAQKLGSLDEAGLAEMRKGNAATVKRGPYAGDQLSVDHIIPRAVVPELDCVIANLELMPLRMNESKNAKIGSRQRSLALKLHGAGLLREMGLQAVKGVGEQRLHARRFAAVSLLARCLLNTDTPKGRFASAGVVLHRARCL